MVLFLGFLFCFIYLCDSSMQFWLMELCNTVWSQGAWYFELCSFFHKIVSVIWSLLWLHIYFRIICSSLMKNVTVNFNRDWIKSVYFFWDYGNFKNINSANQKTQDIFLFLWRNTAFVFLWSWNDMSVVKMLMEKWKAEYN